MTSSLMARLKVDNTSPSSIKPSEPSPTLIHAKQNQKQPSPKPKTSSTVQQLLQSKPHPSSSTFTAPPPFFMCSENEAIDRQSCLELSPFECHTVNTHTSPQKNSADATWDANEISIDFSPTPKKSSLAAAAGLASSAKTSYYSKHSSGKLTHTPPCTPHVKPAVSLTPKTSVKPTVSLTPKTSTKKPRPSFHPRLVVKKYRRSAAGGGVSSDQCDRTLDQLNGTVNYLLRLFATQTPPGLSNENGSRQYSLCETVSFIDDRLRAIQKDLVSLVGDLEHSNTTICNIKSTTLRQMQVKMVRYNILTMYLLSHVPVEKYQVKFGSVALRTCLSCYLNLSKSLFEEYTCTADNGAREIRTLDEIMAYVALLHMAGVVRSEEGALPPSSSALMEESGGGWGALFSTFNKYATTFYGRSNECDSIENTFPRWKWAIDLASTIQSGNYQRYFSLTEKGPTYPPLDNLTTYQTVQTISENARFLILARCCISPSLNLIRLSLLRRYNHSFGKGEKVPINNLLRLLHFNVKNSDDSLKHTAQFCRDAGLPVSEDSHVVMKAAPIDISSEAIGSMSNPGRNDSFVFGQEFENANNVSLLSNRLGGMHVDENIDSWEERDVNAIPLDDVDQSVVGRVDEDGVVVPMADVLSLLVG